MPAKLLSLIGHRTELAHDGVEAIAAAEIFRPEVILLDLGLPGTSGYDAARKIREQPWDKAMTISALTGWGQDDDRRRNKDSGFDHHLDKPVDIDSLDSLLAEIPSNFTEPA